MVLATTDRAAKGIPSELDGVPVVVHRTEKIVAMKTTTVSHTAKQTPPIQLGTSGAGGTTSLTVTAAEERSAR